MSSRFNWCEKNYAISLATEDNKDVSVINCFLLKKCKQTQNIINSYQSDYVQLFCFSLVNVINIFKRLS